MYPSYSYLTLSAGSGGTVSASSSQLDLTKRSANHPLISISCFSLRELDVARTFFTWSYQR